MVKEVQKNGHPNFFNGVFVSIAGGKESQTIKVRNITKLPRNIHIICNRIDFLNFPFDDVVKYFINNLSL